MLRVEGKKKREWENGIERKGRGGGKEKKNRDKRKRAPKAAMLSAKASFFLPLLFFVLFCVGFSGFGQSLEKDRDRQAGS